MKEIKVEITWPFTKNLAVKKVMAKMDFFIDGTSAIKRLPISLTRIDYQTLLDSLPNYFPIYGTPMYRGREIKRTGDK